MIPSSPRVRGKSGATVDEIRGVGWVRVDKKWHGGSRWWRGTRGLSLELPLGEKEPALCPVSCRAEPLGSQARWPGSCFRTQRVRMRPYIQVETGSVFCCLFIYN